MDIKRWNFELRDGCIVVCKDQHEKGHPCEYEELSLAELFEIIEIHQSLTAKLQSRLEEVGRERERYLEVIDKVRVAFPLACTVATDSHLLYPANQYNLIVDTLNQSKRIEIGEVTP